VQGCVFGLECRDVLTSGMMRITLARHLQSHVPVRWRYWFRFVIRRDRGPCGFRCAIRVSTGSAMLSRDSGRETGVLLRADDASVFGANHVLPMRQKLHVTRQKIEIDSDAFKLVSCRRTSRRIIGNGFDEVFDERDLFQDRHAADVNLAWIRDSVRRLGFIRQECSLGNKNGSREHESPTSDDDEFPFRRIRHAAILCAMGEKLETNAAIYWNPTSPTRRIDASLP
jgi:hypothetical protein